MCLNFTQEQKWSDAKTSWKTATHVSTTKSVGYHLVDCVITMPCFVLLCAGLRRCGWVFTCTASGPDYSNKISPVGHTLISVLKQKTETQENTIMLLQNVLPCQVSMTDWCIQSVPSECISQTKSKLWGLVISVVLAMFSSDIIFTVSRESFCFYILTWCLPFFMCEMGLSFNSSWSSTNCCLDSSDELGVSCIIHVSWTKR